MAGLERSAAAGSDEKLDAAQNQLLVYVGGEGGTGKTQLIRAIKALFHSWGRDEQLQTASFMGMPASQIGGNTLHRLTGLRRVKLADAGSLSTQSTMKLQDYWRPKTLLIIDEVSTMGGKLLSKIHERLKAAKCVDSAHLAFGGLHVLFFGDMRQLPPVRDVALYRELRDSSPADVVQGRGLWLQSKQAFFLTKQHRQSDQRLLGILRRLRTKKVTEDDYRVLSTRVITDERSAIELLGTVERVEEASIIVTRNLQRTAINVEFCRRFALLHDKSLVVSVAADRFTGDHDMRDTDRKALLDLPDSQTESLVGLLPLCEGLPVVLKKTINPLLRLCNGSMGRIVRIIRDEQDDQRLETAAAEPVFMQTLPKCVLVHFPECESTVQLKGLPAGVVPIYPVESQSFDFRIHTRKGTLTRKVRRLQIPLHPAKSLTTYGAQGLTLKAVMMDLCKPPNPKSHAQSIYVGLSRVRSLDDIAFLRPFTFDDLSATTPAELDRDIARLDRLAFETQVALAARDGRAAPERPGPQKRAAETINLDERPRKRLRTEAAPVIALPTASKVVSSTVPIGTQRRVL